MFKELMIDIETTGNTHDAVMIQLGAVFFNRDGTMGPTFCENISAQSCIDLGFIENSQTIAWWATQDQKIFNDIMQNNKPVETVMRDFNMFFRQFGRNIGIWSHATFDFVIVQNYMKKLGIGNLPYKGARDIRTLTDLSGIDLNAYDWNKKTHNALDDCIFQVEYCTDAFKKLNTKPMVALSPEHIEHIMGHEVGEELIVTNGLYNIEVLVIEENGKKDIQLVKVWRGEPDTLIGGDIKAVGNKNAG